MSKKIKRVFAGCDQVLHLWANQSQSDARCANVFFEGVSCWSYGRHYELGRLHQVKGKRIAVINSTKYSNTTAKHQHAAYGAVSHMPRLYSSDVASIVTGLRETQDKLVSNLFDVFLRKRFWSTTTIEEYVLDLPAIEEFNSLCNILDKREFRIDVTEDFLELVQNHVKLQIVLRKKRDAESTNPAVIAKKQADALRRQTKTISDWRQGGSLTKALRNMHPQLIRIRGEYVETTKGASVPLQDALKLLASIREGKAKHGDAIGNFHLDSVSGDSVKLGCHVISLAEAESVLGS